MIKSILRKVKNKLMPPAPAEHEPLNFGIETGIGTNIGKPRRLEGKEYIKVGNNTHIGPNIWLSAYDNYPYSNQKFNPQISIGNDVFIGAYSSITSINKVIIEDNVETADFLYISDHTHSITPEMGVPVRKRRLTSRGYVKIGAYTGIGINVCILPGVTIGKYCIIGAQSVVTRSFPDYCMIMGNPAICVKRYDMELKKWVDPPPEKKRARQTEESN
ncbi:acyltransferase [Flavihumibacter sp. ZG627]|uniref:acyltransferase n=1 Tax=Flavihumibacter sp. ZG627 TaxID=1463156 RepID=UPI000694044D|nr:acyltransferase [Flavihumibacter sp. ZG627]